MNEKNKKDFRWLIYTMIVLVADMILVIGVIFEITIDTKFIIPLAILTFILLLGYLFKLGGFFQKEIVSETELELVNAMLKEIGINSEKSKYMQIEDTKDLLYPKYEISFIDIEVCDVGHGNKAFSLTGEE